VTIFANSGPKWRTTEETTTNAGTQALEAASGLWRLLAAIESGKGADQSKTVARAYEKVTAAMELYESIVPTVDDSPLPPLSPAEFQGAALYPYPSHPDASFIEYSSASPQKLYRELITRLDTLRRRLNSLDLQKPKEDLAPQAFQLMQDWEALARLGRVIAVINRRGQDESFRAR
jgi:hypothetical protein